MNWSDISIWKQCVISTFLCLLGCSIGTMGILHYQVGYNWLYTFILSFITGLFTSVIFIAFWKIAFRHIVFKEAIKSSFKMSFVSMIIMIGIENLIIIFANSQQMDAMSGMHHNASNNFGTMGIAMGVGFLFALPYNYYHLQKTGEICH